MCLVFASGSYESHLLCSCIAHLFSVSTSFRSLDRDIYTLFVLPTQKQPPNPSSSRPHASLRQRIGLISLNHRSAMTKPYVLRVCEGTLVYDS